MAHDAVTFIVTVARTCCIAVVEYIGRIHRANLWKRFAAATLGVVLDYCPLSGIVALHDRSLYATVVSGRIGYHLGHLMSVSVASTAFLAPTQCPN